MQRRTLLVWFGRAVYTTCAAAVAVPMSRFLAVPAATQAVPEGATRRQRIARLDELPVGEPQLLSVVGTRQDGWTRHADQVIGRVWVTRSGADAVPADKTALTVFNVACPHSGCPIQHAAEGGFACHCHGARFKADGSKVTDDDGFTNPSPRGMDLLAHSVVKDKATGIWWVEVEYKEYLTGIAERIEKA